MDVDKINESRVTIPLKWECEIKSAYLRWVFDIENSKKKMKS